MQNKLTFGSLLRDRRTAAGLTLGALAKILGISVPYLSDVELGRRNPFDPERMRALAVAIGVDILELEKAAAVSRGSFELQAGPTPLHVDVGAELAEEWAGCSERTLRAVREALYAGARRARKG